MEYEDPRVITALTGPIEPVERDYRQEEPVSAEIFETYRSQYAYDDTPLDPAEEVPEKSSERWTKEIVAINAAYPSVPT